MKKCLIFDFDGVVADTEAGRYAMLTNLLARRHSIDMSARCRMEDFVGLHTTAALKKFFPQLSEEDICKIYAERNVEYQQNLDKYCLVYPQAVESITALAQKFDVKMATANDRNNINILLRHIGLDKTFTEVFTREELEDKGKKSYAKILPLIPYAPHECYVMEDSPVGIQSAKEAGFECVLFNRYNNPEALKWADHVVTSYEELIKLVS
ncbi:MAG: HAD family phosphatase [Prevotellaceae bacterium]|nr:HAD family phosphatase [Prevotellaceae bacterium]